jgi:hypothetical protein
MIITLFANKTQITPHCFTDIMRTLSKKQRQGKDKKFCLKIHYKKKTCYGKLKNVQIWRQCMRVDLKIQFSYFNIYFFIIWPNPSSRTMAVGSTQPLTEMSTRNRPGCKMRPVRRADNLTAICEQLSRQNVGASTSYNPVGLHWLLQG